jgi:hypothetical protein
MTLREKFENLELDDPYIFMKKEDAIVCEKIVDDFAIEFKDWCDNEGRFTIGVNTTKELLQMYKNWKGL